VTRVDGELALLREAWPGLQYEPNGQWVFLPGYPLPVGWSRTSTGVAFQIPGGPPGQPPYAFHVDGPLTFQGAQPAHYTHPAGAVPFPGDWATFSWAPQSWAWAEDPADGANMRAFARSFADRFAEGA
jgi:hypothetical protein